MNRGKNCWEMIFKVGAEGGALAVMGHKQPDGNWEFLLVRDETTFLGLVDQVSSEELKSTHQFLSWNAILEKMDKYPWTHLYPLGPFHDEFKKMIWSAYLERGRSDYNDKEWSMLCAGD